MRDGRVLLAAAAASLLIGVVFVPTGGSTRDGPRVIAHVAQLEGFAQDGNRVVWADTSMLGHGGRCPGLVELRDLDTGATTNLNRGRSVECYFGFQHEMALAGRRSLWSVVSESLSSYHFDVQTSSPADGIRSLGGEHVDKQYGFVPIPMAGDGPTLVYANVSTTEEVYGYGYVHRADNSRIAGSYGTVALAADQAIFAAARVDPGGCACNGITSRGGGYVSPDGRHVIFRSTFEDGFAPWEVRTLRVAATDGSGERVLWHSFGWFAGWAPDGKTILGSTPTGVVLIEPDSGKVRRLATGEAPQFAPDGLHVAFLHPEGNHQTLQIVAAAGGPARSLHPATGLLAWTGDSSALLYTRGDAVFLGDVTSGGERQIALGAVETRLSTSPRGDVVAFRTEDKGALTVVPLGGGKARVVATRAAYFNWSPSGTRLSYVTAAPPHLHVVDADGSGDIDVGETLSLATWSPDGERFAFARNVNTTAESTYVVERGSSPRLIALGGVPIWSPDSRSLLVEDLNRQTLHLLRANGEQVVLPNVDPIEWLPDSRRFLGMLQAGPKAGAIASLDEAGGVPVAITKPDAAPRWVGVELRNTATGQIVARAATAGIPQAVAVDPLRVAVLLKFGKRRVLQIRRRPLLRIERTVPMALSVEHISLAGRWLVYARAHRIWTLDVTSGRTTTIARTHGYVLEPTIEGTRVVWGEQRPNAPDVLLAVTLSR